MAVRVEGAVALRKALRKFEPDLSKELQKEMASFLKPVVKEARSFVPTETLSNWQRKSETANFPYFDYRAAKAGIGYKTTPSKPNSKGFRSLASINNKTASGAIYETAGRKNPNSTFVKNLQAKNGGLTGQGKMSGRLIFKAYEEDKGKAQDGVLRAIEKAAAKLQSKATVNG